MARQARMAASNGDRQISMRVLARMRLRAVGQKNNGIGVAALARGAHLWRVAAARRGIARSTSIMA